MDRDTPLESVFLLLDANSFGNYKDWPLKLLEDGLEVETLTQLLYDKDGSQSERMTRLTSLVALGSQCLLRCMLPRASQARAIFT